jgi:hypothetical protein
VKAKEAKRRNNEGMGHWSLTLFLLRVQYYPRPKEGANRSIWPFENSRKLKFTHNLEKD